MTLGQLIKKYRINQGLTMTDFAEIINSKIGGSTSKGTVSNWEHDVNHPNPKRFKAIAELFNKTPYELKEEIK